MKYWLTLISLVFLTTVSTVSAQGVDRRQIVVALFGDSISVGENISSYYTDCPGFGNPFNLDARPGFGLGRALFCNPDRYLGVLLNNSKRPAVVVNHGIGSTLSGTLANNGISRINAALDQTRRELPAGKAYYLLMLYGTNDVSFGIPPSALRVNTQVMIDRARARGWIPVLGSLLPRSGVSVVPANQQLRAAASSRGVTFVDQYTNFQNKGGLSLHDNEDFFLNRFLRLHPSRTGYEIVAQHWFDVALSRLVEPLPEPIGYLPPINSLLLDED